MSEDKETLSEVFSAFASPVRLSILMMLYESKKPLHIKAVARNLSADYAATYRHVKGLEKVGLLEVFEVGRSRVLSPLNVDLVRSLFQMARKLARDEERSSQ